LFGGIAAPQLPDGRDLSGTEGIDTTDTWDADYAGLLATAQKRLEAMWNGWRPHRDSVPLATFDVAANRKTAGGEDRPSESKGGFVPTGT
jgi:hypothetical protein